MERLIGIVGFFVLLGIAFLMCPKEDRKLINKRLVAVGILLQVVFALLILKTAPGRLIFEYANSAVITLLDFTKKGSGFIFGGLVENMNTFGFIFAFQVLPTIIFFSSLMSILYYLGIMQLVVKGIAKVMVKLMGTSGSESLCAAANIFIGQTEAPLMIRPFLKNLTRSEMLAVMVGGMATISAGVMASYVGMLRESVPNIAGYLISASVMSAIGSLVFSKIMIPEKEESETKGTLQISDDKEVSNVIEAAAKGASDGLTLALNVAAMLLAFIAIIFMFNFILGAIGGLFGFPQLSFELIMSWIFSPIAFLIGAPAQDVLSIARLLGEKLIINEFVAYADMSKIALELTDKGKLIAAFALCGFANLSSIAIQIGGIGSLAPNKRSQISELGIKAMIAATLVNCQAAAIAAIVF